MPTVLVQVMQTNTRGQVVAASYFTVGFPDPTEPSIAFATPHRGAATAVVALGLSTVNRGDLTNVAALQSLIGTAVARADAAADQQADAIRHETEERIRAWTVRASGGSSRPARSPSTASCASAPPGSPSRRSWPVHEPRPPPHQAAHCRCAARFHDQHRSLGHTSDDLRRPHRGRRLHQRALLQHRRQSRSRFRRRCSNGAKHWDADREAGHPTPASDYAGQRGELTESSTGSPKTPTKTSSTTCTPGCGRSWASTPPAVGDAAHRRLRHRRRPGDRRADPRAQRPGAAGHRRSPRRVGAR